MIGGHWTDSWISSRISEISMNWIGNGMGGWKGGKMGCIGVNKGMEEGLSDLDHFIDFS